MAEGAEVAKAFVTLIPSFRGGKKRIENELGGVIVGGSKKGGRAGGVAAAAAIGAGLKKGGLAVTAAAIGVLGVALKKGFSRLTAIEDAQAKLTGLGHSAKTVETIMTNALNAVRGTAFGLDEAATIAAGVVAAGVKPGQDLEKTLKLVADAATIAGTSLGDMGSIFNKVAAGNRLTMEEVNQLSDRGIPILQMLGKEFGVTALEARKMVEEGEVDFKKFRKVIEDNMAGAALESGETTRGAFANVGAALARFGAALLSGVFPHLKTVFNGMITLIDNATAKVGPFVDAVSKRIGAAFQAALPYVQAFIRGFQGFTASGGGPFVVFVNAGNKVRQVLDRILPALSSVSNTARSTLLPTLVGLGRTLLPLANSILSAFGRVAPAVAKVATAIGRFIGAILPPIMSLARQVVQVLAPAFRQIGRIVANEVAPNLVKLLDALAPIAKWIVERMAPVVVSALKGIVEAVKGGLEVLSGVIKVFVGIFTLDWDTAWSGIKQIFSGALTAIVGVVKNGFNIIKETFNSAVEAITSIVGSLGTRITILITKLWAGIKSNFQSSINATIKFWANFFAKALSIAKSTWNSIKAAFTSALNSVKSAVSSGLNSVVSFFRSSFSSAKQVTSAAWNSIRSAISSAASGVVERIRSAWNTAKTATSNAWNSIKSALRSAIDGLLGILRGLPGRIKSAVGDLSSVLFEAGRSIIRGLIRGIENMIGALRSKLKSVTDMIPKVKGPLPVDLKLLEPSGKAIMTGLIRGIEERAADLRRTLVSITRDIPGMGGGLDLRNLERYKLGAAAVGGGDTYIFNGRNLDINERTIGPIIYGQRLRARVRRPR